LESFNDKITYLSHHFKPPSMDKLKDFFPDRFENLGIFILILILTFAFNWGARRAFNRFMRLHTSDIKVDVTNYKFLGNALSTIIFTLGIIFAVREYPPLRTVAGSVLAGAGILAAVIGFASQQAFSNIISGIFIIIFKPFRVNDRIRIKEMYSGVVEDITLRHTVLRDDENRRVIIPNAVINSEILVNADYNDDAICRFVEFSIGFKADIDHAKRIMAEEIGRHPNFIDRRTDEQRATGKPLVEVRVVRMTDFAVVLRGSCWALSPSLASNIYCDSLESIKKRFDTEGVEMPYPQMVIAQKTV
jgi:small conductance mechanosensitive channel